MFKSANQVERNVARACICYMAFCVAIVGRVLYGLFHVADIILSVGILIHVALTFKGVFKTTNFLLLSMPALTILSIFGLPTRIEVIAYFVCFVASWICSIVIFVKRKELGMIGHPFVIINVFSPPLFSSSFAFLKIVDVAEITYTEWKNEFVTIAIVSLVVSVVITVLRVVSKFKKGERKQNFWAHVGCFLLSAVIAFGLLAYSSQTFNYALDFSEGEPCVYTVLEKKTERSRRSRDYELRIFNENETREIDVTSEKYRNAHVGDNITLYKHNGFFGMEYYEYE